MPIMAGWKACPTLYAYRFVNIAVVSYFACPYKMLDNFSTNGIPNHIQTYMQWTNVR